MELLAWFQSLSVWYKSHGKSTTPPNALSSEPCFGQRVRTVLSLLVELIRAAKQAHVQEALNAPENSASKATTDANAPKRNVNHHYPGRKVLMLSTVAADMRACEWTRLRAAHPEGTAEAEQIATKKRKITSSGLSGGVAGGARAPTTVSSGVGRITTAAAVDEDLEDPQLRLERVLTAYQAFSGSGAEHGPGDSFDLAFGLRGGDGGYSTWARHGYAGIVHVPSC